MPVGVPRHHGQTLSFCPPAHRSPTQGLSGLQKNWKASPVSLSQWVTTNSPSQWQGSILQPQPAWLLPTGPFGKQLPPPGHEVALNCPFVQVSTVLLSLQRVSLPEQTLQPALVQPRGQFLFVLKPVPSPLHCLKVVPLQSLLFGMHTRHCVPVHPRLLQSSVVMKPEPEALQR